MTARHEILGGKVQVFKRPNTPFWHCSATVGGHQFRASTREEGLSQAKEFAEDWFLNLRGKDRWGGGLPKGKTFRKAAEKFLEEFEVLTDGERSPKYVETLRGKISKHLNPFFGDKPVNEITESVVQDYRVHRAKTKDKDGNPAPPARTTSTSGTWPAGPCWSGGCASRWWGWWFGCCRSCCTRGCAATTACI